MVPKGSILIVEDEKSMREVLRILLEEEGYDVSCVSDGLAGIDLITKDRFDLVISDIRMPKADGFEVLRSVKEVTPSALVIMITAFGTTDSAIEAMKLGAYDYIHKPFKIDEIRLVIRKAFERIRLAEELRVLREQVSNAYRLENIIGKSPSMQELFALIPKIAQGSSTVLITGESGSGKELVAAALHALSQRKDRKFVTINCATFPEGLLESELFGHVKGAFTGAVYNKEGLFETANDGTVFLDEVAELPAALQPKLLRVLENGTFRRVGGVSDITVDVRVIAATNRNLSESIASGAFREDLFYRLNVIPLRIPPLRERVDDIPLLIEHFLVKYSARGKRFAPDALRILIRYPWKGNVRELENMVERVVLLTDHDVIQASDLPREFLAEQLKHQELPIFSQHGVDLEQIMAEIEKDYLQKALAQARGGKTEAAKLLNLSFRSFRHKLYKYGIR